MALALITMSLNKIRYQGYNLNNIASYSFSRKFSSSLEKIQEGKNQ